MSMKEIMLADIMPDPNQPRKFFDEAAMNELTDSVREKGVLQPILVRPIMPIAADRAAYMLVCGERRYRASMSVAAAFKSRSTIPAVIRELTDDEALELQIIENLQRKDVHPLEEAVAFKSLLDHGKDIKEIAARVGKSEFYARQRMKLNALSKDWQTLFYTGRLNISTALAIAAFDEKTQKSLFDEAMDDDDGDEITISAYTLKNLRGDLNKATFDLADPSLDKKMGPCCNCQFNSGTASLFPDAAAFQKCANVSCFKGKTDTHFARELDVAKTDPTLLFVAGDRFGKDEAKTVKAADIEVLQNGYHQIDMPELLPFEDWYEDNEYIFESKTEARTAYDVRAIPEFTEEMAIYEGKVAGGKFKKAFVLSGDERGKYVYINVGKPVATTQGKVTAASIKEKEKEGNLTAADIDAEIARLETKEARNKQLDILKTHTELLGHLRIRQEFKSKAFPLQGIDRGIMVFLLLNRSGFQYEKIKGMPVSTEMRHTYDEEYFNKLSSIGDDLLALLIRKVAFKDFGVQNMEYGIGVGDTTMRLIARYLDEDVDGIDQAQHAVAMARHEKLTKRISELKAHRKKLEKPAKTPSKQKTVSTPPPPKNKK